MRQDFIKMWCNFIRLSQYVYLWQSSFQKALKSIGIYTSKVTFWHCLWSLILYKRRKHSHQSWMTSKMLLWSLFVNKMLHFDIHIYTTHTHTRMHTYVLYLKSIFTSEYATTGTGTGITVTLSSKSAKSAYLVLLCFCVKVKLLDVHAAIRIKVRPVKAVINWSDQQRRYLQHFLLDCLLPGCSIRVYHTLYHG